MHLVGRSHRGCGAVREQLDGSFADRDSSGGHDLGAGELGLFGVVLDAVDLVDEVGFRSLAVVGGFAAAMSVVGFIGSDLQVVGWTTS